MSTHNALVTGATGAIGPSLVNCLLREGYTVRSYGLDEPSPGLFVAPVEHITGDINDPERLSQAVAGMDTVFHLAALLHIEDPPSGLAARYQLINVDGSRVVAEQAGQAGVRRLVYFSTVKVYGVQSRTPVTEDHATNPTTLYANTKLEGEHAVKSVPDLETTILRLSAVFGPRLKGAWSRLVRAIEHGWFVPVGSQQNQHSLTYVDDVARAAAMIATLPQAANQTLNVVGYETPTMADILAAIYAALDKRIPAAHIPGWAAFSGAALIELGMHAFGKQSPVTREAVNHLIKDEVYSGAALRQLGFQSELSLPERWRNTLHPNYAKSE
ncbi:MAG: NAD-dependent epimerase/dehydratase family protein [Anaerolineae bacterium]|nr:NAD-dependent epimerase/dehydratase family protein [Anaerolineae bacterium]